MRTFRAIAWPLAAGGMALALGVGFLAGTAAGVARPPASPVTPAPGSVAGDADPPGPTIPPVEPTPTAEPSSTPAPAPLSRRFGVVAHLLWGDDASAVHALDQLVAAGLGVVRFDVSWQNMEPSPGRLDGLDRLDRLMGEIAARGMRPVITVIETPGWANGGRGPWVPPLDPNAYASFVGSLASRYATQSDVAWEVWNEPNDPRFWRPAPDPAAYTRLLRLTSAAIRAAAPGATVLGGSILYGDRVFLDRMYAAGARGTFDGLAVHPYAQNRAPGDTGDAYHSFEGGLDRLRAVMVANGDADTPMWITEMGWQIADGLDERTQARYFAQAVAMVARRRDVRVFAAYVFGPAAEAGYELEASGDGSVGFTGYRDAVLSVAQAAR